MKKVIKRALCMIFIVSVLLFQSSCGIIVWNENGADTDDTSAPTSDTSSDTNSGDIKPPEADDSIDAQPKAPSELARERLEALLDRDLSTSKLIIATSDREALRPTGDTGSAASRARGDAFRAVEEKYNTEILLSGYDTAALLEAAKTAYNTDMYFADLIAIPQNMLGFFHAEGILANMNSLPFTNYSAEYYNHGINEQAKIGSVQFGISGAINFDPDKINCVYFNRMLVTACGVEDIYSLVREGEWTFDTVSELSLMANDANQSILGIGARVPTLDFIDICASAQGMKYVNTSADVPTVDYFSGDFADHATGIVTRLYNMIYKDKIVAQTEGDTTHHIFTTGSLLFCVDNLSYAQKIANSESEWGILPMPKYNSEQEVYISPTDGDMQIFCALANTPHFETSGLILEALNCAAYGYVDRAYKDTCIDYYLRDSGSIGMLDVIIDSAAYDFAHMFASGVTNLENATYKAVQNAVTTRSTLSYYYNYYRNSANRYIAAAWEKYE